MLRDVLAPLPLALFTAAEMREADRRTIALGVTGGTLMNNAGAGVAAHVLRSLGRPGRVAVICGPGNNGGDGFVAARLLQENGCEVTLALLGSRASLRGDAAAAAEKWRGTVQPIEIFDIGDCDIVVDALFGTGLARPLSGKSLAAVTRVNAWRAKGRRRRVVAVDIPSGVDSDSGAALGGAIQATSTVSFCRLKLGHWLAEGRSACGAVEAIDIGIPDSVIDAVGARAFLNVPGLWRSVLPEPAPTGHKYTRGHAVILSGPAHRTGAARLAARGALRAGAGLVTLASPAEALRVNAAHLSAIMLAQIDDAARFADMLSDPRKNAVGLGPGLGVGASARSFVEAALSGERDRRVALDADALTSFAGDVASLAKVISASGQDAVLTPHEGEFARLFPDIANTMSKIERARAAAAQSGAVVILKGADTVVASPDGRAAISSLEAPWLATAGSGDVLTGIVTGLLAQRTPTFEAAVCAVWLHARAAQIFGPGLIAEDIPESLPQVWRELFATPDADSAPHGYV